MKLPLILAAAGVCALGGCSLIQPATQGDAEKALTVAHLAFQATGVALEQAAQSGALHGGDAATAQALYDKAGVALDLADRADDAANADGVLAGAEAVQAALADIGALLPKH